MLKLAVFLVAALAGQCLARYEVDYIIYDPHVRSHYGGYQTCSYSSPAWLQSFYSNRISIESVFSDLIAGRQHPTIQSSFRITFTRPGLRSLQTQTYAAPNPALGFSNTFISGVTTTGWVDIVSVSSNTVIIVDYTTGTIIVGVSRGTHYNLYMYAPSWFVQRGRGIMVQGCPYKDVYPWQRYSANPNWGRRKRQAELDPSLASECVNAAKLYEKTFPEFDSLNAETIQRICEIDAQFIKGGIAKQLIQDIDPLKQADEIRQKKFSDDTSVEAYKDFSEVDIKKV